MKNRIRLTESQLHSIIKESVKKTLNEIGCPTRPNNKWEYQRTVDQKDNEEWPDLGASTEDDTPINPLDKKDYFSESITETNDYLDNSEWKNVYNLGNGKISQERGHGKNKQFRTINQPTPKHKSFDDYKDGQNKWKDAYKLGNGKIVQQRGKQFRTVDESKLHKIVKESINNVLNEWTDDYHYWFNNDKAYGSKWWNPA